MSVLLGRLVGRSVVGRLVGRSVGLSYFLFEAIVLNMFYIPKAFTVIDDLYES